MRANKTKSNLSESGSLFNGQVLQVSRNNLFTYCKHCQMSTAIILKIEGKKKTEICNHCKTTKNVIEKY